MVDKDTILMYCETETETGLQCGQEMKAISQSSAGDHRETVGWCPVCGTVVVYEEIYGRDGYKHYDETWHKPQKA